MLSGQDRFRSCIWHLPETIVNIPQPIRSSSEPPKCSATLLPMSAELSSAVPRLDVRQDCILSEVKEKKSKYLITLLFLCFRSKYSISGLFSMISAGIFLSIRPYSNSLRERAFQSRVCLPNLGSRMFPSMILVGIILFHSTPEKYYPQ